MRRIIAVLMLVGVLGGLASLGPIPRASAQVGNQGTITIPPIVSGEVTQKFSSKNGSLIAVNGQVYQVPIVVYNRVTVGTVVQFDGTNWSIISGGI